MNNVSDSTSRASDLLNLRGIELLKIPVYNYTKNCSSSRIKCINYISGHCIFNDCTVWIGGNDQENENTFVWSRHGNLITDPIWGGDNPNNQNDNEDCIEIRLNHGMWNDRRCDHVTIFVCEKDIN